MKKSISTAIISIITSLIVERSVALMDSVKPNETEEKISILEASINEIADKLKLLSEQKEILENEIKKSKSDLKSKISKLEKLRGKKVKTT